LGWGGEKRARPGPIGIDLMQLLLTTSGRQRCFKLFLAWLPCPAELSPSLNN
jgi:hypothetical protein